MSWPLQGRMVGGGEEESGWGAGGGGGGPHVALESTCRPDWIDHKGWRVLSRVFHSDKFLMEIIPFEYGFMFIKQ